MSHINASSSVSSVTVSSASSSSSTSSSSSSYRGADGEKVLAKTICAAITKNPIPLDLIKFLVEEDESIRTEITVLVTSSLVIATSALVSGVAAIITSYVRPSVVNVKLIHKWDRGYDTVLNVSYAAVSKRVGDVTDIYDTVKYFLEKGAIIGDDMADDVRVVKILRHLERRQDPVGLRTPGLQMIQKIVLPHLKQHPDVLVPPPPSTASFTIDDSVSLLLH